MARNANPQAASSRTSSSKTALALSSLVLLAAGSWLGTKVRFALRAHPVQGEVTRTYPCRLGRRSGSCGDISYHTAEGSSGSLTGVQGTGPTGTKVDLLYDPAEPDSAQLSGPVKFWLGPVALTGLALVFVGTSALPLIRRRAAGR